MKKIMVKAKKGAKCNKIIAGILTAMICATIAFSIALFTVIIPNNKYNNAKELIENGNYEASYQVFREIVNYRDSQEYLSHFKVIYDTKTAIYNDGATTITTSYTYVEDTDHQPEILVLVGPSGSGKIQVAKKLLEMTTGYEKLIGYSTKAQTSPKEKEWYHYISRKEYFHMLDHGEFFESTMYAGHGYGTRKDDVDAILASGKCVLATMDICGAMALKTNYQNVTTVFIKKDRRALLTAILGKTCSDEDKVTRIIAIDDERRNADICDHVVSGESDEEMAQAIIDLLHLK